MTSVARSLFDFAEVAPFSHLEQAFEEAERRRLLDLRALEAVCERSRGRRGLKPVTKLLAQVWTPQPRTRSDLERAFLKLCRDADLPQPAMNVDVEGYEVDALWEDAKLVVEVDSYEYHRTPQAFERDRARDAALLIAGYRVIRVTDRMLEREPAATAARLASVVSPI